MTRDRLVGLLAGLLVLAAGCQGPGFDRQTVTPAEVPSAERTVSTDAELLADQHRRALENRSYTTTVTFAVRYPNGSTGRVTDTFAVASDDAYRYERRVVGPYPETATNRTIWEDESVEVRRQTDADGTVTVDVQPGGNPGDTTLSSFVERLLGQFELNATEREGRLTGRAERVPNIPLPPDLYDHRNATVEVVVRDDIVRTVDIELRADYPDIGRTVRVEIGLGVERVGETTPTRPDWADEAAAPGE